MSRQGALAGFFTPLKRKREDSTGDEATETPPTQQGDPPSQPTPEVQPPTQPPPGPLQAQPPASERQVPANQQILHNYMAWSAVLLEEQGKLRGLTWKRTGIGYLKKADFMARVQEHDKGPKRQQQATQQAPLPDADKASEGYDSAASQASRTSQSSKKWHTKVSKKQLRCQFPGVTDDVLWAGKAEGEEGFEWSAEPKTFIPVSERTVPPHERAAARKKKETKDPVQPIASYEQWDLEVSRLLDQSVVVEDLESCVDEKDEDSDASDDWANDERFAKVKARYSWLVAGRHGYYCALCRHHRMLLRGMGGKKTGSAAEKWIETPFVNMDKLGERSTSHGNTASHKAAAEAEMHRLTGVGLGGLRKAAVQENRLQLMKLVCVLYFLVKEGIAHTTNYEPLIRLITRTDTDLRSFVSSTRNATYTSTNIATQILEAIDWVLRTEIEERVKKSPYLAILADETENVKHQEELSIFLRGTSERGVWDVFWCMLPLDAGKDAASVTKQLIKRLRYRLPPEELAQDAAVPPLGAPVPAEKFVAIALDGTNTMSGEFGGVQARLKWEYNAFAVYVWCSSHKLQLAVVWAAMLTFDVLSCVNSLRDLFFFLRASTQRMGRYRDTIQEVREKERFSRMPNKVLVKSGDTRWLTNERSAAVTLRTWPAIYETIEDLRAESGDALSTGLVTRLLSPAFIASLFLLREIFGIVCPLSLQLQKGASALIGVSRQVEVVISSITAIKDLAPPTLDPQSIQPADIGYHTWPLYYNWYISEHASGKTVGKQSWSLYHAATGKVYCEKLVEQLKTRFKDYGIVSVLALFDPKYAFGHDCDSDAALIDTFVEHFTTCKTVQVTGKEDRHFQPMWSAAQGRGVKHELPQLLKTIQMTKERCTDPEAFSFQDALLYAMKHEAQALPRAVSAMRLVATYPSGTSAVERSFSVLKDTLDLLRNRLTSGHLDMILRIRIEGPPELSMVFLEKVVDRFVEMVPSRRLNFVQAKANSA